MKMVEIEGKEVIYSTTFMIANDKEAKLKIPVREDFINLTIEFISDVSIEDKGASWVTKDGVIKMSFKGWNNSLGTCVLEPTKFGNIGEKRIYFQLAHHYVGAINLVHFYIMIGE